MSRLNLQIGIKIVSEYYLDYRRIKKCRQYFFQFWSYTRKHNLNDFVALFIPWVHQILKLIFFFRPFPNILDTNITYIFLFTDFYNKKSKIYFFTNLLHTKKSAFQNCQSNGSKFKCVFIIFGVNKPKNVRLK